MVNPKDRQYPNLVKGRYFKDDTKPQPDHPGFEERWLEDEANKTRLLTEEEIDKALAGLHSGGILYCASVITGYQDIKTARSFAARMETLIDILKTALPSLQTIVDEHGNRPNHIKDIINKVVEATSKGEEHNGQTSSQ